MEPGRSRGQRVAMGWGALVLCVALVHAGQARAQEAAPAPAGSTLAKTSPAVQMLYVEIPSGSALTNAMMATSIGSSASVKQLIQVMALGETADLHVVVGSKSDRLALKAAEAALKSFQGKRLEHLTLGVLADAAKVEALRPLAEPLGVTLMASPSLQR